MTITQIAIPAWNGVIGNYSPGRTYYNGPNKGKQAVADKIVLHWSDNASLGVTDKVFTDASRMASAHFAIQDGVVHQYVKLQDTSYNAGVGTVNCESVSIEHTGMPGVPISDATYEASAQLIVKVCQFYGWVPSRGLLHAHNEYIATECPGTLDIGRLALRVGVLWSIQGQDLPVIPVASYTPPVTVPVQVSTTFWVTVTATPSLNVRAAPTTKAARVPNKQLFPGDQVEVAQAVMGESVSGNSYWLKTKVSGLYIWSGGTNFHH